MKIENIVNTVQTLFNEEECFGGFLEVSSSLGNPIALNRFILKATEDIISFFAYYYLCNKNNSSLCVAIDREISNLCFTSSISIGKCFYDRDVYDDYSYKKVLIKCFEELRKEILENE